MFLIALALTLGLHFTTPACSPTFMPDLYADSVKDIVAMGTIGTKCSFN